MTESTPKATPSAFEAMQTADLMRRGLALTAGKLSHDAALSEVRSELADRARAEVEASGTVPTWRVTGIGRAQLTDPQPQVKVTDEQALAGWAVQRPRYAAAVSATITIPAADLERALEALEDAAVAPIHPTAPVTLAMAAKARAELLEGVGTAHELGEVLTERQEVWDPASGEVVDGVHLVPAAPRVFSLVLDAEAKKRATAEGSAFLLASVAPAAPAAEALPDPGPVLHDGWGGGIPAPADQEAALPAGAWVGPSGHVYVDADDAEGEPEYSDPAPAAAPVTAAAAATVLPSAPLEDSLLFLRQLADKDLGAQPVGTLKVWCATGLVNVNERAPKPVLVKRLAAAIAEAQALEAVPATPTTGS